MKQRRHLLAVALLPACLSVPDGPKPECEVTSDCDTARGEVCDEGLCWGNPPAGPFAVRVTPPGERKNDLVESELEIATIPADGFMPDIQLEEPIIYRGAILCPGDCGDLAATIIVTRGPSETFPNGPGHRQIITTEPRTGQFTMVLPAARPEEPFTITVTPGGRDLAPSNVTLAQLVPPLRTELRVVDRDPKLAFDLALGDLALASLDGTLKGSDNLPLGMYRVVALGRYDSASAVTEVSTVDYTTSDGKFQLKLPADLDDVLLVATPYGAVGPTLRMSIAQVGATGSVVMTAKPTGRAVGVTIGVKGAGTGGEVVSINGARVSVTGSIPASTGQTITTFTAVGDTDEDGFVTLELLDGEDLQADYRVSVVPPAGPNGVIFDEPFSLAMTTLPLPDRVPLVGKVLDPAGNPLKDVTVTVRPSLRFQWSLDETPQNFVAAIPAGSAITPETGEFVVYVDPKLAQVPGSYDILFEPLETSDAPEWTEFAVEVPSGTSSTLTLPTITLPDAAHVRATITDVNGTPIDGAELRLFSFENTVSADLCDLVDHAPQSCPIPARLLGHGSSDASGIARLTLPRL